MLRRALLAVSLFPFLLATGCNSGGNDPPPAAPVPVVQVAGPFALTVGQAGQLTAQTYNGVDAGYVWTCDDPSVVDVDATGRITAMSPGTTYVRATGATTGTMGRIGIVVADKPADIPFWIEWQASGHADRTAEAFVHWDGDGAVSTSCAKCHSTPGFRDFLGDDGTPAGTVENAAALGTTVECAACHNPTAAVLDSVVFPSGAVITGLSSEAVCMQCHQGRASTATVDDAITAAALADDDTVSASLSFKNVHYFPAAATRYGAQARGGYQYAGKVYDVLFRHVPGVDTCVDCHNQHSLEVRVERCADCHDVTTAADLKDIRMIASRPVDYDGDGDRQEGIHDEIEGLRALLLDAIEAYGRDVAGMPIVYDVHSHPYFFGDANGNGAVDAGEGSYKSFTPRLLRATYNYQFATKDPGAFAHNAKYVIQLLYDSLMDLNGVLPVPLALNTIRRDDPGHFDGAGEPARHWDADGEVSASCAKCHSGSPGLAEYLTYHMNTPQHVNNGLDCATCHTTFDTFALRLATSITFPGEVTAGTLPAGTAASDPKAITNLCGTCHSGRESKKTIDDYIATGKTAFRNVHYLPAAGILFGTEAKVGYEYPGKTYAAQWKHFGAASSSYSCTFCHAPKATEHSFDVKENLVLCQNCHAITDVGQIRIVSTADYDGDGNTAETLEEEIHGLAEALYARMRAVTGPTPILYDAGSYPYFFKDLNADGIADPNETVSSNGYKPWTPALMKAAHNFQISHKEPGAWAHNFKYMAQLLIDSIEDLGGNVSAFTRP